MRAFGIVLMVLLEYHGSVNSERIEADLIDHLLNGYHVKSRPVNKSIDAVNVSINLNIYQLIEIKEKLQYIKVSAWIAHGGKIVNLNGIQETTKTFKR